MKIAVTTDGSQVFQHFGKCPVFTLYTIENGKVLKKELLDASANGHAALTAFLKDVGTDTVICGGIGEGAKNMLAAAGIRLFSGVTGDIDSAVAALLDGTLCDMSGGCNHEGHEGSHTCECTNHCG